MGSGVSILAVLYNYVVECLFISWVLSLLFTTITTADVFNMVLVYRVIF